MSAENTLIQKWRDASVNESRLIDCLCVFLQFLMRKKCAHSLLKKKVRGRSEVNVNDEKLTFICKALLVCLAQLQHAVYSSHQNQLLPEDITFDFTGPFFPFSSTCIRLKYGRSNVCFGYRRESTLLYTHRDNFVIFRSLIIMEKYEPFC